MKTKERNTVSQGYLNKVLFALGAFAITAGTYVAWPALVHLGGKLV